MIDSPFNGQLYVVCLQHCDNDLLLQIAAEFKTRRSFVPRNSCKPSFAIVFSAKKFTLFSILILFFSWYFEQAQCTHSLLYLCSNYAIKKGSMFTNTWKYGRSAEKYKYYGFKQMYFNRIQQSEKKITQVRI